MTSPGPQDGRQQCGAAVGRSLSAASRAWSDFDATMQIFQANVQRGDIAAAEAERPRLESLLTDYLDHYALAGRLTHRLSSGEHE